MKNEPKIHGLIGHPLCHSYSPQIHKALGAESYELFDLHDEGEVAQFLAARDFNGVNVTIPYKKAVLPCLDAVSDTARAIGSVNTIVKRDDGTLLGDNTDVYGLAKTFELSGISPKGCKALVLGDGGVAPAVREALRNAGATGIVTVSRKGEDNYGNMARHSDASILVNATPAGMYPRNGEAPVRLAELFRDRIGSGDPPKGVVDLIYNPHRTALLLEAEELGIPCANGLTMLVAQAKRAREIFTGEQIGDGAIEAVRRSIESAMLNIVLIGMPGSGKSTCGRMLAELTGRPFVDLDEEFAIAFGVAPANYIEANGEAAFRAAETAVLERVAKGSGQVISTGGGVVTVPGNKPLMRQNGFVVFIDRPTGKLTVKNRPISQAVGVEALARERLPLYNAWADAAVRNSYAPQAAAEIKALIERR